MLQDFLSVPLLREIMTSKDNKAWMLPVGVFGELGSPEAHTAATEISKRVTAAVAGSDLTANLTGPAATLIDMVNVGQKDQVHIEIATIVMLLAILLMIYRNPVTLLLPLISIGVSLAVAQGVIAGMAEVGLTISNQTIIFLNAMMAGTGVDYAVFPDQQVPRLPAHGRGHQHLDQEAAMGSVGKVIAASAATVAVTFLGMVFTRLSIFSTVGIALAVGVAIACLSAVTFLPALMVLAGRRGMDQAAPGPDVTVLATLGHPHCAEARNSPRRQPGHPRRARASCSMLVKYNYDDRRALPQDVDSSVGYKALDRHFPVESDHPAIHLHSFPMTCGHRRPSPIWNRWRSASPKFRESPSSAALPAPPGNPRAGPAQLPGGRSGHPIARRVHPDQRSFRRPGSAQERGQPVGGQPRHHSRSGVAGHHHRPWTRRRTGLHAEPVRGEENVPGHPERVRTRRQHASSDPRSERTLPTSSTSLPTSTRC